MFKSLRSEIAVSANSYQNVSTRLLIISFVKLKIFGIGISNSSIMTGRGLQNVGALWGEIRWIRVRYKFDWDDISRPITLINGINNANIEHFPGIELLLQFMFLVRFVKGD